jgi:hypothetical protein
MKRFPLALVLAFVVFPAATLAQKASEPEQNPKTTQAYSLLIQQKVKLQAELENLLSEYTSDWPKSKKVRFELDTLRNEMKKMAEVEESKVIKLTAGYGSLVLRRIVLAADVQMLSEAEGADWPPLKQKQRELELLDKEIQKVMR